MKPILFNTEMVRAILDGRKTVTRRAVKYTVNDVYDFACINGMWHETYDPEKPPQKLVDRFVDDIARPPYRTGDVLYVRETWSDYYSECLTDEVGHYLYRADYPDGFVYTPKWHPSIHMPRKAARLFLRVTGVRVQQLKDVTEEDARAEGFGSRSEFMATILKMYPDSTEESWFWVIEFERITKEEANDTRKTV